MTKIFLASDHAGLELKNKIYQALLNHEIGKSLSNEVHDLGPQTTDSVDYPDFADALCKKVHGFSILDSNSSPSLLPKEIGILVCGSGQGMAMRANKHPQIRAALCWNEESTQLAREHNNANVLCLGGRLIDHNLAIKMIEIFLSSPFAGGRHQQRVLKISTPLE